MHLVIAALLLGGLFLTIPRTEKGEQTVLDMTKPRGIRLNNPGNIRHGDNWRGMAPDQPDESFVYFVDPRYGYRAMTKILKSYARRGITTVQGIISTWAPPVENNTGAYIRHVSQLTGLQPSDQVDLADVNQVAKLLDAITRHENGQQPFSQATIREGIAWA